jgi:hypothetical protein
MGARLLQDNWRLTAASMQKKRPTFLLFHENPEFVKAQPETRQAVEDWGYWAAMGYEF